MSLAAWKRVSWLKRTLPPAGDVSHQKVDAKTRDIGLQLPFPRSAAEVGLNRCGSGLTGEVSATQGVRTVGPDID